MARYQIIDGGYLDTETGRSIPQAPGNRHYREVLKWLEEGNTPDPAPEPDPNEETLKALTQSDADMARIVEDLIEALGISGQLPQAAQDKLSERAALRAKL